MTALVWFRRDLRVHDHPALRAALERNDRIVPVFCFDDRLLHGRHASGPRTQFLLECLADLDASLRDRGGGLVVRHGFPERELVDLAREVGAGEVHFTSDVSPFARERGDLTRRAFEDAGLEVHAHPGLNVLDEAGALRTQTGKPYTVFTPYYRSWDEAARREVLGAPRKVALPSKVAKGTLPSLAELGLEQEVAEPLPGGEHAGRERMRRFLDGPVHDYATDHDALGADRTSRLSPYLHFGCISARELEDRVPHGEGPAAFAARSAGATSTTSSCTTIPPTRSPSSRTAIAARFAGATPSRHSGRGPRGAPATRSSTPGCASCATRAGCTIAPGSSSVRS